MKVLRRQDRLAAAGGTALFVVHDEPERVGATMLAGLAVPYPVLVDLERRAYADWGLHRARWATVYLDPRVWLRYARMLAGGERMPPTGRDTLQLGGDFVVGPDGRIVYARPQQVDDRPPVGVLLQHVEDASGR